MESVQYCNCEFLKESGPPSDYDKQIKAWLKKHGVKLTISYQATREYFPEDREVRNVYRWTLRRGNVRVWGTFGDSILDTQEDARPTAYDILSCLTKYDPGSFENFCSDFGYDADSIKAHRTYRAVASEWKKISRLLGEESDALSELRDIN